MQEYVTNPATSRGYKFDLRIHTIIVSLDPYVAYVFDDGIVKQTSLKYEHPNAANKHRFDMHITNRVKNSHNFYEKPCKLEKDLDVWIDF